MPDSVDKMVAELHVLVVDDNAETRDLLQRMLLDFDVTGAYFAKSGDDARQYLNAPDLLDAVDLILCDWNMPGMTGLEFLRQIRSSQPDLPFIMITGNAGEDFVVEARTHGVTSYIVKPFSSGALYKKLAIIAQLLAKRREEALAR